jgi:hypothetical protein
LAVAYGAAGRLTEAIKLLEQVRDVQEEKLGADHPSTLTTLNNLAHAYQDAGELSDAIKLFEHVRDVQVKVLGADHAETLGTVRSLAVAYHAAGKPEQALPLFIQAAAVFENRKFQDQHAGLIVGHLIACQEELKQYAEAEAWHRKWLIVVKEQAGGEHPVYTGELASLGLNILKQRKCTDAEPVLRECLALREKLAAGANPSVLPWQIANVKSMLGEALAGQQKYGDAESLLLAGYEGLKEHEATIPPQAKIRLTEALKRLLDYYAATGQEEKADEWRAKLEAAPPNVAEPKQ